MREIIRIVLLLVNIISFIGISAVALFILYCEFFGYDKGNRFLKNINFPLDDNGIIVIGFIIGAILIASILLRKKLFL